MYIHTIKSYDAEEVIFLTAYRERTVGASPLHEEKRIHPYQPPAESFCRVSGDVCARYSAGVYFSVPFEEFTVR